MTLAFDLVLDAVNIAGIEVAPSSIGSTNVHVISPNVLYQKTHRGIAFYSCWDELKV